MPTRSEEVIAAKEAEVAGVTSTWVPPTETGLEHSAAIADSSAVAIGAGGAPDGGAVKRVFKSVGAFENEGTGDAAAPADNPPVMKVKPCCWRLSCTSCSSHMCYVRRDSNVGTPTKRLRNETTSNCGCSCGRTSANC